MKTSAPAPLAVPADEAPDLRNPEEVEVVWDAVIVGGGPAGLSAAVVLARANRKVMVLDAGHQRNINSHGMHNFLTRDGIAPAQFLEISHKELEHYGAKRCGVKVVKAERLKSSGHFRVTDEGGATYRSRKLLLATGVRDNIPDVPGMAGLWGSGVHHCPYCDGHEASDKTIGLYSRDHNGFGMALALRAYSKDIVLFTDGRRYLRRAQREELNRHHVLVVPQPVSHLRDEEGVLKGVVLKNGEEVCCDSMFVNHGYQVNNELYLQLKGQCTAKGAARVNRRQECSISGLYVAGDAAHDAHFVVVAAAHGAKAGISINDALLKEDNAASLALNKALEEKSA